MGQKSLCKYSKSAYEGKAYQKAVINATHVCGKCGRAVNNKKNVCKPVAIKLKTESVDEKD